MKKYFIPKDDTGRDLWFKNFANKLPAYTTKYGINNTEMNDMILASQNLSYWLNYRNQFDEFLKRLTRYKNELLDGVDNNATAATSAPTPPTVPSMPAGVLPGILERASSIAQRIKKHKDYIESDGLDMGLEGADEAITLTKDRPILRVSLAQGGHPMLEWKKGQADAMELYVDRGTGYVMLTQAMRNSYTDNAALPPIGESKVWKYRAIFRHNDQQVGSFSDEVSISVTSMI